RGRQAQRLGDQREGETLALSEARGAHGTASTRDGHGCAPAWGREPRGHEQRCRPERRGGKRILIPLRRLVACACTIHGAERILRTAHGCARQGGLRQGGGRCVI